jgi:pseudouridylate synthase / pseudouridine kinase
MPVQFLRAQSFLRLSTSAMRVRNLATLSSIRQRTAPIDVHPEVQDALSTGKPIVALETALVTHGLPYPRNLEAELSLEKIVRSTGSVPATIEMIGGRVKIGLQLSQLEHLADTTKNHSVKLSRRDIGPAIAMKRDGGTTISATLIFASVVGIKVSFRQSSSG